MEKYQKRCHQCKEGIPIWPFVLCKKCIERYILIAPKWWESVIHMMIIDPTGQSMETEYERRTLENAETEDAEIERIQKMD